MPLSKAERRKLLKELESFLKKFSSYCCRLAESMAEGKLTKPQQRYFRSLRSEVQREYGGLQTVIEEYGGRAVVFLSGREYEAFDSAFNYTQFSQEALTVVMDSAINALNKAIGKLKKENSGKSSIYELTSPVYWAEHFWRWRRVATVVGWVKTNRLLSTLITAIIGGIIATLILRVLGVI